MYNFTNGAEKWRTTLTKFLNQTQQFYPEVLGGVMYEICEDTQKCNADQQSFKAYFSRFLGVTMQLAPWTREQIWPRLSHSAVRAAQSCTGPLKYGSDQYGCGMRWYKDGYDGVGGVGQQMTALNTITVLNVDRVKGPYSSTRGGTSKGDAGLNSGAEQYKEEKLRPITTGDRAGAAILTIIMVACTLGGAWFISF